VRAATLATMATRTPTLADSLQHLLEEPDPSAVSSAAAAAASAAAAAAAAATVSAPTPAPSTVPLTLPPPPPANSTADIPSATKTQLIQGINKLAANFVGKPRCMLRMALRSALLSAESPLQFSDSSFNSAFTTRGPQGCFYEDATGAVQLKAPAPLHRDLAPLVAAATLGVEDHDGSDNSGPAAKRQKL